MSITLSAGLPEYFVDQFKDTLYHVCQQRESLFGQAVRVEPLLNAEDKAFDMMDILVLEEKTGRNVDTPTIDPSTQRRWVSTTPYHNAVLFDKDDDLSMIVDPTSDFVRAFRAAVNRKKDDIILASFNATIASGRHPNSGSITWAGQSGNVKYTRTSGGRTIPHDCSIGNCSASDTKMTVEKAELILEYFAKNEVDEQTPIFCAINPAQRTDLFGQEEYTSIDYNGQKPLATGQLIKNWHGINWILSNKVVVGTSNDVDANTNVYKCWAWAQDGIILGVQNDVTVEMSTRVDKSYSQQVYVYMNMGAMRMDEDRILCVECQ